MADQFVDSSPGAAGTTQNAAVMDALVVAQSFLKSGGIPATSGTLVATQPATEVVINRGDGTAIFVPISATTVTMTASSDNYVDVTTAGAYTVSAVSVGAGAPSLAAQTLRLYKATTSGTAITAVTQLATPDPISQSVVGVDTAEAATMDTLTATSTMMNNLNRLRNQVGVIVGGVGSAWNAAVQMIPLAQKGAASGVASLNASSQVVQASAVSPATSGVANGLATLNGSSLVMQDPASKGVAGGVAALNASSQLTATATAGPLTINGSATVTGLATLAGVAVTGNGSVGGLIGVTGDIQGGGHLRITGTAPSASSFSTGAFGAGASGNVTGTDNHGTITVTTGAAPGTGLAMTLTFATAMLNTNYHIALSVRTGDAWRGFSQGAKSTTGWALYCDSAPAASTNYFIDYIILSG